MRTLAILGWLMMAATAHACDVCGIYLGIQPHDRVSSFTLLYRYRHLEGVVRPPFVPLKAMPKHGDHGGAPTAAELYRRELYQVAEWRADLWLGQRFAVMAALPMVNNYAATNGYVTADVYGVGDPFAIARYMLANTRCGPGEERWVHRLTLGAGIKAPLGRTDATHHDVTVAHDQQPGTGTWDGLATLEYLVRKHRTGAALTLIGRHNGPDASGHRMGFGLSSTAEVFRRYPVKDRLEFMPFLGLYHELTGQDAHGGEPVDGTGSSTLFSHAGVRAWWGPWALMGTFQFALAQAIGEAMVPNRERIVIGLTYNLLKT